MLRSIAVVTLLFFLCSMAEAAVARPLCRVKHPSDSQIEWECKRVKKGETPESLFGDRWIDVLRFNRIDRRHIYPGIKMKFPKRPEDIKDFTPMPKHYQPADTEPRFILVNLAEQFLGAYEYGQLVFSLPVATGERRNETPAGEFRVTAYDSMHQSSLYFIEKTQTYYPMHYGLRFYINREDVAFWIHGRDLPGYAASHGCIGLYDEEMQKKHYGFPKSPVFEDAKKLFEWVISPLVDDRRFHVLKDGPKVLVIDGNVPATGVPGQKYRAIKKAK